MGIAVPLLRYLWQIWWKLPGNWKQKKKILSCVAIPVRDYAERNPHGGYDAIVARFGEPEQIAASYLEELDISDLKKQLSIRKRILYAAVAVGIIGVGIWAGVVLYALHEYGDAMPGYIEVTVEKDEYVQTEGG